jgi:creatinine amidohydrolase
MTAIALSLAALLPVALATRPLTAPLPDVVELKDMTWVEVRSALQAGYSTVIVPTGGIEQNGPHMVLGKHDYIVAAAARQIAKEVGRTLVAPVVSFVPEGSWDPPTGHLRFPGTIGVSDEAFAGVLDGIARSLKSAGFKTICFIGDHGQSQTVQAEVAERLTRLWSQAGVRVIHVAGYYAIEAQTARLLAEGMTRETVGMHASVIDTSELMSVHPKGVDLSRFRQLFFPLEQTGVAGNPTASNQALGANLLRVRIDAAAREIKSARRP